MAKVLSYSKQVGESMYNIALIGITAKSRES